ncbi:NifU family protein [Thermaurantimonas aggregans]|uniref:NifU family protein n=2 Tax=Schleiferiaceae TaxID=1333713 RepID=A0A401XK91_9FLAO|nr:NifU family protein [Thermaurantimonas aggregans]MCX8148353.1 NifU family protein [Thermaurantimonas aggregans]GCD77457.1 NifU family protein [Thermaurantimonas aggregans]
MNPEILQKVEQALSEVRPFLQTDGGDVSLVEISDDLTVKIRLHGTCVGCNVNQITLKAGVETTIKKYVPDVKEVIQVA